MEIVSVAGVAGVAEAALQFAFAGSPEVQVSVTDEEKEPIAMTGIVYTTEPPAVTLASAGELVIVPNLKSGAGGLTVKFTELEVRPLCVMVTGNVPAIAMRVAGIVAASEVGWPVVSVVTAVPLKFTTESARKFVPVTVNVNWDESAATEVGLNAVIVGAEATLTVKLTLFDVCPFCVTVTGNVPAIATRVAGIVAASEVGSPVVSVVTAMPLKFTTESARKFVPVTVRVNCAEPSVIEVGFNDVIDGLRSRRI